MGADDLRIGSIEITTQDNRERTAAIDTLNDATRDYWPRVPPGILQQLVKDAATAASVCALVSLFILPMASIEEARSFTKSYAFGITTVMMLDRCAPPSVNTSVIYAYVLCTSVLTVSAVAGAVLFQKYNG